MASRKELLSAATKCMAELDALQAVATPDAEAIKAKSAEFDGIQAKVESFDANAKRKKMLADAKAGEEVDTEGKDLRDPAIAANHEEDARAKEQGFFEYCISGKVSGQMREALAPQSKSFSAEAKTGVVMPDRMKLQLFGKNVSQAFGKIMGGGVPGTDGTFSTMTGGASGTVRTIPHDFRAMLLELGPEPAYLFQLATVVPAPYGSVDWPILQQKDPVQGSANPDGSEFGGVYGGWIAEGAVKPDANMVINQMNIKTHEYAAYTELTNRLLSRSAIQLEPLLTRLFRDVVLDAYDRAILLGNGVTQPLGLLNVDPQTGALQTRVVSRDVANNVGYVDLVNLEYAVLPYHRASARWSLFDGATRALKLLRSTTGFPLWIAGVNTGFQTGIPSTIIGYPFISTIRQPAVGTRGDVIFGDFSQYIVAMEEEVVVQRSEHFAFNRNVTSFRVSTVIGGRNSQPRAFSVLDSVASSTTGPAQGTTGAATTTAGA